MSDEEDEAADGPSVPQEVHGPPRPPHRSWRNTFPAHQRRNSGAIAQLVERRVCTLKAAGSNPAGSITTMPSLGDRHARRLTGLRTRTWRSPTGRAASGCALLMDAYGLRPRIEEMAERIAERGYVVLAPNVFYRAGRSPVIPFPDMSRGGPGRVLRHVMPLMGELTPERTGRGWRRVSRRAREARRGAVRHHRLLHGRPARPADAAAHPDRVAALGGFHGGGLVTDDPKSPHLSAPRSGPSSTSATPTTTAATRPSRSPRSTPPSTMPA